VSGLSAASAQLDVPEIAAWLTAHLGPASKGREPSVPGLRQVRPLHENPVPTYSFAVDDVEAAHRELEQHGITFVQLPTAMGGMVTVILDDTCGTLVQLIGPA
jgi:predicted enzyme related to lactoylglutathione lyase